MAGEGSAGLQGRPRPGPARCSPGIRETCLLVWILGKVAAVSSLAAQRGSGGAINPWHSVGPPLPAGRAPETPASLGAPTGSTQRERCSPRQVMAAGKSKVVKQVSKPGKVELKKKKNQAFPLTRGEKDSKVNRDSSTASHGCRQGWQPRGTEPGFLFHGISVIGSVF